jgi:hypothetical protein
MELALELDDERLAVVLFARGPLLPKRLFDWACAAFWYAPQTTITPRSIDVRTIAIPPAPSLSESAASLNPPATARRR